MKRNIVLILALICSLTASAQIMKIYKGNILVKSYSPSEADKVVFEPARYVETVSLNQSEAKVNVGSVVFLTATVLPEDADNKAVSWTSSNAEVAKVDSQGSVSCLAAGTAVITCEAQDGSGAKASCTFTVIDLGVKVRVGFYETIPGYSVMDLKLYPNSTATTTDGQVYLYNNQSRVWGLGTLSNYATRESHESASYSYLGRSQDGATATDYISLSSYTDIGALTLRSYYQLISSDGSGEVITIRDSYASIPSEYTTFQAGHSYTFLFRIYDHTNNYTAFSSVSDLYPIKLDAFIDESPDGTKQIISITDAITR